MYSMHVYRVYNTQSTPHLHIISLCMQRVTQNLGPKASSGAVVDTYRLIWDTEL